MNYTRKSFISVSLKIWFLMLGQDFFIEVTSHFTVKHWNHKNKMIYFFTPCHTIHFCSRENTLRQYIYATTYFNDFGRIIFCGTQISWILENLCKLLLKEIRAFFGDIKFSHMKKSHKTRKYDAATISRYKVGIL